jgi:hypothetical protein
LQRGVAQGGTLKRERLEVAGRQFFSLLKMKSMKIEKPKEEEPRA